MTLIKRTAEQWNQFWFRESSTQSLGLLRIFYGICLVCKATGLWGFARQLPQIQLPFRRIAPLTELGDMYRDPIAGFEWIPAVGPEVWQVLETIGMLAAAFWTVGFLTRLSGLVVFLGFAVPMMHSRFDYWHHSANYLFFMMLFVCLDMGRHYSYDAILFRKTKDAGRESIWPIRMVQVLLTWVYISTLFGKLNRDWFDGTVMQVLDDSGMLKGPFRPLVISTVGTYGLSLYTLFAQTFFAIVVWTRFRRWAFLFGSLLHIGIDMLMNVTTFSFQMMSLYICFIDPRSGLTEVFYDSQATRQRVIVSVLRYLNWFDRISWRDVRAGGISHEPRKWVLSSGKMTVRRTSGEYLFGIRFIREVAGLLPLTFLFSFMLEPFVWCALCRSRRLKRFFTTDKPALVR